MTSAGLSGLLAGEHLKLSLARLNEAYHRNNKRRQEVEKLISLSAKKGDSLWSNLRFEILRSDLGYAGSNQIVRIRSVSVSIPAVIGPYETFNAVLEHADSKERITISRGIDDMGVFPDALNDGRYLPFEGLYITKKTAEEQTQGPNTHEWCLSIGEEMAAKISDVILSVKFTVK